MLYYLDYDINWRNNDISFNIVVTITSQMFRMFAFVNLTRYTRVPPNKARRFRWKGTTGPRIIDKSALEGRAHPSPSSLHYTSKQSLGSVTTRLLLEKVCRGVAFEIWTTFVSRISLHNIVKIFFLQRVTRQMLLTRDTRFTSISNTMFK